MGTVFWKGKILVPEGMRNTIFFHAHLGGTSHSPLDITLQRIKNTYNWPNLERQVRMAFAHCDDCRQALRSKQRADYNTGKHNRPFRPHVRWQIDFKGPLPVTPRGNRYLVGITDVFSGKRLIWPRPNARSEDAIVAMEIFMLSGICPDELIADNVKAFVVSKDFHSFLERKDIELIPIPSYSPESNSGIERKWKDFSQAAKTSNDRDWDLSVFEHCFSQNNKAQKAFAGYSAVQIETGIGTEDPLEVIHEKVRAFRRGVDKKNDEKRDAPSFVPGEKVDLWRPVANKLQNSWVTAFVKNRVNPDGPVYEVVHDGKILLVNVRRLRKVPLDPFAYPALDLDMDLKYSPSDAEEEVLNSDLEEVADVVVPAPGDVFIYRDGNNEYFGLLKNITHAYASLQELVLLKKKKGQFKVSKVWVDTDGVICVNNYSCGQSSEPVIYKIDPSSIVEIVQLHKHSFVPASVISNHPRLVVQR